MSVARLNLHKTLRPLLFNDPNGGRVFEVPAGTACTLLESIDHACNHGYLDRKNESDIWAARANLQRGFSLVWLKGALRGIPKEFVGQD